MTYFIVQCKKICIYQSGCLLMTREVDDSETDEYFVTFRVADIIQMNNSNNPKCYDSVIISRGNIMLCYYIPFGLVEQITNYLASRKNDKDFIDDITDDYHDKYIQFEQYKNGEYHCTIKNEALPYLINSKNVYWN